MLRRKLFAFGISFSLGIYSGYLFRDKMNLPGAMAVALSCILALLLLARSGEIEPGDVANILLWAVAGVLVISWNGYRLDSYGRELVHGENADREIRQVGRIVDVRKGDSSWSFTVKDKNGGRSQVRISNEDIRKVRTIFSVWREENALQQENFNCLSQQQTRGFLTTGCI